ncbi:MAG TPA: proline racemase family protein [Chiayiivirga sp.]|nr:proline racemase family protein [Chiayiivirga sp.]
METIEFVDSHTGGEPTRMIVSGFPDLGAGSLAQRRERFARDFDHLRQAMVCEPRGSDVLVGAVLTPATDERAVTGVIFFNNVGTLGMCGHGAIGVIRSLQYLGRIGPGEHGLETPVGTVGAVLHDDGRVSIRNVEAWRHRKDVTIEVPGFGVVRGDVAWGGNWFFITEDVPVPLVLGNVRDLTTFACAVRAALEAGAITGAEGAQIDHVELTAASPTPGCDARNFVLCPGLAWDRSPCGTGTSAKLACLAADGVLAPDAVFRQESLIGSVFEGRYQPANEGRIQPTITGTAHVTAQGHLIIDAADPFGYGFAT